MGYRENREVHEGGGEMKGFIEVHNCDCTGYLLNVNAIKYIFPDEKNTYIYTREGEEYIVKDDYETVKKLIQEATEIHNKYVIDFSDWDISQRVRHDWETYGKIKEDTFKEILKRSHEKQDREKRKNG